MNSLEHHEPPGKAVTYQQPLLQDSKLLLTPDGIGARPEIYS
jgi:hypothetical protein